VLSDEGQVLSWGFDGHVQLGHSSIQCQKIPAVIDALADQHVIHVTCGGSSLAAITGKLRHDLELHLWYTFFFFFFNVTETLQS
jgi:alpha-tubulin suppressor-like RCC1 family protein